MKLFDTLTNKELEITSKKVRIYLCGVTVYDEAHIGHARTIIVFDTLRRYLESKGHIVNFVQNFTDVDDKIINRAILEKTTATEISKKYILHYFEDFDKLGIKRATAYPKATEHIEDMINLIQSLIDAGFAYVSKNGVYYLVSKFNQYGKLSKKNIDELISGARVEVDESKKDPLDFALWKFTTDDPSWPSPWGKGRPGWHIECSAMSLKYLGPEFEIHGGGRDLIFPHHENEIAQTEAVTKKPLAKIWMHVGMVTINGEKMSKSLGNIKSVRELLQNWGPNIIRLFCLSTHYAKPTDYSEDLLRENVTRWRQVETAYYEMALSSGTGNTEQILNDADQTLAEFNFALENDFNTPLALNAFFKLVKTVNRIAADELMTKSIADIALPVFERMLEILGLRVLQLSESEKQQITTLIEKRNSFRALKKFKEADEIRNQIRQLGIILVDHKDRTLWVKQEEIKAES